METESNLSKSFFHLREDNDPELIESIASTEPILAVADVVLQEHDLTLIRSAVTLTVTGELEEPDPEELEDESIDDESILSVCEFIYPNYSMYSVIVYFMYYGMFIMTSF